MPRRERLKSVRANIPNMVNAIHDRQATELPINAVVAPVTIDDPFELGCKVLAVVSLRDDPLGWMRAHGQIDEAKFWAGRRWQQFYEAAEIGGIRGMDTTREPVDGGGINAEILTERGRKARLWLLRCTQVLGLEGEALVRDVLGRGLFIAQAASSRGLGTRLELEYLGKRFRECLETLAEEFGYA